MKMDVNKLAEHFARTSFCVEGVYHYICEPGWTGCQKTMPYPGFIFQLNGEVELIFNGTPYLLTKDKVVHGGADMSLNMTVTGTTNWEYFLVLYKVKDRETGDIRLPEVHFELEPGQSPRLTELLWNLWRNHNQPGAIFEFQTEMLFRCVLGEIFVCSTKRASLETQELFQQISQYIQEHYMDSFTMQRLAEQHGISKNRLAYLFYKYAGMGPGDYLMQYRLNRAKELLLLDASPLRTIAQATGFNDPFYFSRAFKKRYGIPPSEFREKFINSTC